MIHRLARRLVAAGATAATIAAAAVLVTLGADTAQAASANLFASVTASGTLANGRLLSLAGAESAIRRDGHNCRSDLA